MRNTLFWLFTIDPFLNQAGAISIENNGLRRTCKPKITSNSIKKDTIKLRSIKQGVTTSISEIPLLTRRNSLISPVTSLGALWGLTYVHEAKAIFDGGIGGLGR